MKCKECEYHEDIIGTLFCNACKRPIRIDQKESEKDAPCAFYDNKLNNDLVK